MTSQRTVVSLLSRRDLFSGGRPASGRTDKEILLKPEVVGESG
jgi:hypothetical protein